MKLQWQMPHSTDRGWPRAFFDKAETLQAVSISCGEPYDHEYVVNETHLPLTVFVADHSVQPSKWRQLPKKFATLAEAQAAAQRLFDVHGHFVPEAVSDFSDSLMG